jgi:hypothetical protein
MGKNADFIQHTAIAVLLALVAGCQSVLLDNSQEIHSMNMPRTMKLMFRIKEPLQIYCEEDGDYILPVDTVIYYDRSSDEGRLYWVPFYHKGKIAWEEVPMEQKYEGVLIVPLWLENIDATQLKNIFERFPLAESDDTLTVQNNSLTRGELADIIQSMPKQPQEPHISVFPGTTHSGQLMHISRTMKSMFCIKEPLKILGKEGGGYILPVGTVLYYDEKVDDGHTLYWIPFKHKGKIEWEEIYFESKHKSNLLVPFFLENIDDVRLADIVGRFPLTKSDVEAAIKANAISKDDMVDIIRSMPE